MPTRPGPAASPPDQADAERQMDAFVAKFDADVAALIRACRAAMRERLPTAIELVYDNYNFFVIGYAPTERASDALCSLACDAHGVALAFLHGATLPDPEGRLRGSGKQNRTVRLASDATLREPAVAALLDAAVAQSPAPMPTDAGHTVIKSVSAKQRPRTVTRKS